MCYFYTKTMTTECPICVEKFNGSNRKKACCPYCQQDYCRECVGSWLTSLVDEPRCLNDTCKKPWNREFLDTIMTKVWRDSVYREYRETLLFDRERALLPATQPRIEGINEAKRIENEIIEPMRNRRRDILKEIALLHVEEASLNTQVWDMMNRAERLREGIDVDEINKKNRSIFVRRCPSNGCRGFLSSQWKCGTCELYSCSECQEVKGIARDSPHTCDPANVETAKLIAKDTKACPKCGEMITKIDGCDQMWCVSCHSAFSWKTGQIASGVVHNPHFYEWQRRNNGGEAPRNPGDVPCGGFIEWHIVRRAIWNSREYPGWLSLLEAAHRMINHVQNVDMTTLNRDALNINDNIDLRIQYLLNEIDDNTMKSILQQREKKKEKEREIYRVYETLTGASADIFRRLLVVADEKGRNLENFKPFIKELNELRLFINDALDVLRRRYNCTLRGFGDNWTRTVLKKTKDTPTDIKTPFGEYDCLVEELITYIDTLSEPKDGEDPYVLFKTLATKIRKVRNLASDFPRLDSDTRKFALALVEHFEHCYHYLINSGLTRQNASAYYLKRKNDTKFTIDAWREHRKGIELVVEKPTNTIE